jgi:hypothetical protein
MRTQDVTAKVDLTDAETGKRETGIALKVGKRMPLTNQTNIVAGDWHYFLAHDITAIGRVNILKPARRNTCASRCTVCRRA